MHKDWLDFLQQHAATISDGTAMNPGDAAGGQEENIISDLSHLEVLAVTGKDAGAFLHAQFTSDVSRLEINSMQASAWCNIKGRVTASFLLFRSHDGYYLLLQRDISEHVARRLQMFVLRSDVRITRREDLVPLGIRGEAVHTALQAMVKNALAAEAPLIIPQRDSVPRSILLVSLEQAKPLWLALAVTARYGNALHWSLYDIQAGVPWVGSEGSDEFLPQSLNLDLVGGLSFNKGCYPGQEIIARMHFRGKLKQRLFLASVEVAAPPAIKTRLYSEGSSQYVGLVVNASMREADRCWLLATLDLQQAEGSSISLGIPDGPALTLLPLPYAVA